MSSAQLPPLPQQLPKTQSAWDRFVVLMQTWQQLLQPLVAGGPLQVMNVSSDLTLTQQMAGSIIRTTASLTITVPPLLTGTVIYLLAGSSTTCTLAADGTSLALATGGTDAQASTIAGRGNATLVWDAAADVFVFGQGVT